MLKDKQLILSDGQAITSTPLLSTYSHDLEYAGRNLSPLHQLCIPLFVTELFTDSGNDASLLIELISDSVAALTTAPVAHDNLTFTFAQLQATGFIGEFRFKARSGVPFKRHVGLRYTTTSGPFTAGNIRAPITIGIDRLGILPPNGANFYP